MVMNSLFAELDGPVTAETEKRAAPKVCLFKGGCWELAVKHNLCEAHKWQGTDWTRETAIGVDGEEFTYIAMRVLPQPSDVDAWDLKRAALEEIGEKVESSA